MIDNKNLSTEIMESLRKLSTDTLLLCNEIVKNTNDSTLISTIQYELICQGKEMTKISKTLNNISFPTNQTDISKTIDELNILFSLSTIIFHINRKIDLIKEGIDFVDNETAKKIEIVMNPLAEDLKRVKNLLNEVI